MPITLILLAVVFGALIAAGIPLLLAATSVITALSLLAIPGHWLPVGQATSEVTLLIGMAVGIDYSLFYLRREREERARGATVTEALRIAAGTSGRAIVISGLTVMIALAGLFLTGAAEFTGIAFGAIAVVGVAVIGSLTFVPAMLSWLGRWADRARIPFLSGRAVIVHFRTHQGALGIVNSPAKIPVNSSPFLGVLSSVAIRGVRNAKSGVAGKSEGLKVARKSQAAASIRCRKDYFAWSRNPSLDPAFTRWPRL